MRILSVPGPGLGSEEIAENNIEIVFAHMKHIFEQEEVSNT